MQSLLWRKSLIYWMIGTLWRPVWSRINYFYGTFFDIIGLVYLLKEVTENNDKDLLTAYLSSYPDCIQIFILMQLSIKLHDQDNVSMLL